MYNESMTNIPITKEQVIFFMMSNISLGTYDKRFIFNLGNSTEKLTTNQSMLLDKIISRYHKQFAKKGLNSIELLSLPWTKEPIPSSPQYTEVFISIENNEIKLRSPFKKDFISEIKKSDMLRELKWNHADKFWFSPITHRILKNLISLVTSHYSEPINYCPIVSDILKTASEYNDIKYWNPTLVSINNNLYVVACNESLYSAIEEIELNTEIHTLVKLSHLGIVIDEELVNQLQVNKEINITQLLEISPNFEISDTEKLMSYLREIKADLIIVSEWYGINRALCLNLIKDLKSNNFNVKMTDTKRKMLNRSELQNYSMPVCVEFGNWHIGNFVHIAKTIALVNSNPINLVQ